MKTSPFVRASIAFLALWSGFALAEGYGGATYGYFSGASLNPVTNRIYAGASGSGLVVIDEADGAFNGIPMPLVNVTAVDPTTNRVYAGQAAGQLVVLDGNTHTVLATVPLGAAPVSMAVDAFARKLFVTTPANNRVVVVDLATHVPTSVTLPSAPGVVAVDPVRGRAYVGLPDGNSLAVLEGATISGTIPLGASPGDIAVNHVTNKIYVLAGMLVIVDGATHATSTLAAGIYAEKVAVNSATNKVYVASHGQYNLDLGEVTIVDGVTLAKTTVSSGGYYCCRIIVNHTTNKTYASANGAGSQTSVGIPTGPTLVIDGTTDASRKVSGGGNELFVNPVTNRIYRTFHHSGPSGSSIAGVAIIDGSEDAVVSVPAGNKPEAVAVDIGTNKAYVANRDGANVTVIDGNTLATTTVAVGADPVAVAVNSRTHKAYVANFGSGTVTVIDAANATQTVTVGTQPKAIGANTITGRVFVVNQGSNNVSVIDGTTHTVQTVAAGAAPSALAVDEKNNRVYVTNSGSANVSVIDGTTLAVTTVATGNNPTAVAVDPDLDRAYVANTGSGTVTFVNGPSFTTASVLVGTGPMDVVVNPLNHKVYVVFSGQTLMVIINGLTNSVHQVGTYNVPPPTIAFNQGRNRLYLAGHGLLTIQSGSRDSNSEYGITLATGAKPTRMAVNPVTNTLFIPRGDLGVVEVLREITPYPNGLTTTISPLPGHSSPSNSPRFTFTTSTTFSQPVKQVYYRVGGHYGPWLAATGSGNTWSGATGSLGAGTHTVYAFAVDARAADTKSPIVGEMASYTFTVTGECATLGCVDMSVTHSFAPADGATGRDLAFKLTTSNLGTVTASGVVLTDVISAGSTLIWATPGCALSGSTITCPLGPMAGGTSKDVWVITRPGVAGTVTNTASIAFTELDPQTADNQSVASVPVTTSPAGVPKQRYRLYSPVTLEHHFTTDLNEYNVLGSFTGTWIQEGTVGKVLDNPGSFNGVEAVPYYRMYDTTTRWHHWTTDANEYYTLAMFPWWNAEGVDGWILPTATAGAIELFRLLYPPVPGLHHWTIDPVEYDQLINVYGWIGEGGSGFVVQ